MNQREMVVLRFQRADARLAVAARVGKLAAICVLASDLTAQTVRYARSQSATHSVSLKDLRLAKSA